MTRYQIESALRRDDLALAARAVDAIRTVEHSRDPGHEPDVVLVDVLASDEPCLLQALEVDDVCGHVSYVPLAFGPVQEGV